LRIFTSAKEVFLSVCLLATSRKNYWSDPHENFTKDVSADKEKTIKFLKSSADQLLDPDLGILKVFFSIARQDIFPQFGSCL